MKYNFIHKLWGIKLMNVINFSDYITKRHEIEQDIQSAYKDMLAACTNPEYLAQCLQDMNLVEQT